MSDGSDKLSIRWVDLHDVNILEQKEWFELSNRSGSDIWFTPNWLAPWVKHFARHRKAIAACVYRSNKLVGLVPFVIDQTFPFGLPVRMAQLAGPHPLFGVMKMAISTSEDEAAISLIVSDLLTTHNCQIVSLAPLSDSFGLAKRLTEALNKTHGICLQPDTKPRGHTIIRLPDSFDAYIAGLSRNRRNKYRKTKRVLEDEHNIRTETCIGSDALPSLQDFYTAHENQWKLKGKLGHFSDWPGSHDFYRDLCQDSDQETDARLYLQRSNQDEIATGLFCFVAAKTCHALVPSRHEEWSRLKLDVGLHAQFERIEHLIEEGVEVIDSGAGEYDYKASLKGETVDMHRVLVSRDAALGRIRMNILRRYSDVLDLVFYRVWYNKIAPKLRLKGIRVGGLWRSWIRSRV